MPSSFRRVQAPPLPAERLSRAALYALRVGAISATAAACGGESTSTVAPSHAAAAADANVADADDDGAILDSALGVPLDALPATDVTTSALYGGVFPLEAGVPEPDANFLVPYGLPPPR
ncbi:MAG: hypothetical protein ABSF69_28190 [Polyangiaceae bacterium]